MHCKLGRLPQTLTQRTFREKSLGTSKASSKRSGVFGAKVLRIFKGLFQKPLKARFGTQFQLLTTIKKTRHCRVSSCKRYQLGHLPQTLTKGLFVKSPLESQKLHKNKVVYFEGNSLAHFSFKKSRSRIYAKTEKYSFRAMPDSAEHENSHTIKTRSASLS